MTRPLTEFIQAQWLPWRTETLWPHLTGVAHRVLSRDDKTGALTTLLRFPAGWVANAAPPCPMHEELYALDGAVSVNAVFFAADFYGFLPAGFPRQRATAPDGSVALAVYTPTTSKDLSDYDHSRWEPRTDVFSAIWPAAEEQQHAPGQAAGPLPIEHTVARLFPAWRQEQREGDDHRDAGIAEFEPRHEIRQQRTKHPQKGG